jgi:membrane protease YdiL (CAAX protease family)
LPSTPQQYIDQLQLLASAIALLAMVCGVILYVIWRKTGIPRQLVGKERATRVPWDWLEVFLSFLLLVVVYEGVVTSVPWARQKLPNNATATQVLGGWVSVRTVAFDQGLAGGIATSIVAVDLWQAEQQRAFKESRIRMINAIIFLPLVLLFFFNIVPKLSGAKTYQFGLHLNRWKENFTLGTVVWMVLTPFCNVLMLIVFLQFWETLWGRPAEHPMGTLLKQDPQLTTWLLVGVAVCILAPLREELLMRGVVQPYLVRNPVVSDVVVIATLVYAFVLLLTPGTGPDRGMGMGPLFYVAVVAPGYYLFEKWTEPWIKEPGAARGIFTTSLLFSIMHAGAWPLPIPMFLFSLAVGFLAYRTRSLVGPLTVHVLFNLTTMVAMVLEYYPKWK